MRNQINRNDFLWSELREIIRMQFNYREYFCGWIYGDNKVHLEWLSKNAVHYADRASSST